MKPTTLHRALCTVQPSAKDSATKEAPMYALHNMLDEHTYGKIIWMIDMYVENFIKVSAFCCLASFKLLQIAKVPLCKSVFFYVRQFDARFS